MSQVEHDEFEESRIKAEIARAKRLREAAELAEKIGNMLNLMGNLDEMKAFIEGMSRQHRTLQQGFTELCLLWFTHLSELGEFQYDLRNEHSVRVAKMIRERLEQEWGSAWNHTPYI